MSSVARRAGFVGTSLALVLGFGVMPPVSAAPGRTITLVGSLQSEVGCPGDWQPDCAASMLEESTPGIYSGRFTIPAGSYEYKVAVNGTWDENYGAGGVAGGANLPLAVAGPATLDFTYDDGTHVVTVAPTDLPGEAITPADRSLAGGSLRESLTRENFYFVMTDRFANGDPGNDTGGLTGDRQVTGLDPTNNGYYHGGDLAGIIKKLDYIKGLGTTSIWLTPSFKNRAVQGDSAGYHGYWITDFTQIDPHLGTNAEMKALIANAHKKGMKVFFDIITNHTADVIDYSQKQYTYISKDTAPYKDAAGKVFNDEDFVNSPDFPTLDPAVSFPYTPVLKPGDETAKTPAWLNDVTLYHNRGDSTFAGESSTYGDFVGLDDLFTEQPRVEKGMEDIYKAWVDFGIDGFRIDTVKHVNLGFWQKFGPALDARADAIGNDDFFMFGEVYSGDPTYLSTFSTVGKLPATLDFAFQDQAVGSANGRNTASLASMFAADDYYTDADSNAYSSPTFLGNHDMGRVGYFVGGSLAKDKYAHALMYTLRGQPVVYYGDEQGFTGTGGDKAARQDMFASQVAQYNLDDVIGGPEGAMDRYNTAAPLYQHIAELAKLRQKNVALADGAQITRYASNQAGIFAVSRIDRTKRTEYLVVANNADTTRTATFPTFTKNAEFDSIYGGGRDARANQQGTVTVTVPPLGVRVLRANRPMSSTPAALPATFVSPTPGGSLAGRQEIRASIAGNTFAEGSFAYRLVGTSQWQALGTDDNAPYRVFHDVSGMPKGTMVEYRTVVRDLAGHLSARSSFGIVGDAPAPPSGPGVDDVDQPASVTIAGDLDSEIGCPGDWQPDCTAAQLALDTNSEIWGKTFTLPAGSYAYKVAINNSWDENYGAGAVPGGSNIAINVPAGGADVTFTYDHRTHWVTSSLENPLVAAVGNFQSEMGCSGDWDPACLRGWLQDPDDDGTFSLATVQIPPGNYEFKVALNKTWDVSYGAGGGGNNIPFSVTQPGSVVSFTWDSVSKVPAVGVAPPVAEPDLSSSDAAWIDYRTISYPTSRLPIGTNPATVTYRLHWGELAIDATSLGGQFLTLTPVEGAPPGQLALRLPGWAEGSTNTIKAGPMVAIGVYDDSGAVIDATSVAP